MTYILLWITPGAMTFWCKIKMEFKPISHINELIQCGVKEVGMHASKAKTSKGHRNGWHSRQLDKLIKKTNQVLVVSAMEGALVIDQFSHHHFKFIFFQNALLLERILHPTHSNLTKCNVLKISCSLRYI